MKLEKKTRGNPFMYKGGNYTGISFIIQPIPTPHVEEFKVISDRVAHLLLKINTRTKLEIIQV